MSKSVILTGIRANNDLHIGNYFGALLPIVDMARQKAGDYQINLFVPDLHSFTTPIDHSNLYKQTIHNLKLFVAAGLPLEHDDIHIYRQSFVPAHSELTWILDCFTGFGEMRRMIQFKDKVGALSSVKKLMNGGEKYGMLVKKIEEEANFLGNLNEESLIGTEKDAYHKRILALAQDKNEMLGILADYSSALLEIDNKESSASVGLFNYPVLMSCDILLYGATLVPVGDDQTQHLEYTRDIAERMNAKFGEILTVPKSVKEQHEFFGKDQGLRIKDLVDPTKKMSKSNTSDRGIVFLGDSPDEAAKKIMGAETDSLGAVHLDLDKQPGISNLLQIHALLSGETLQTVAEHHDGQASYGDLKKEVAGQVKEFLTDFQSKLAQVDEQALMAKLEKSEEAMNEIANATLDKVQKAVGLRR